VKQSPHCNSRTLDRQSFAAARGRLDRFITIQLWDYMHNTRKTTFRILVDPTHRANQGANYGREKYFSALERVVGGLE
jgi:hypothetical protein